MSCCCSSAGRLPVAVVEFHAFKDNNNTFIVKEFAIVAESLCCQIIFRPPYVLRNLNEKTRRSNRWLTRRYHCIRWDDGTIPYDEGLIRNLCASFSTIYTKGLEKVTFLKRFHPNVLEITSDEEGEREEEDNYVNCLLPQHSGGFSKCALYTAQKRIKYFL